MTHLLRWFLSLDGIRWIGGAVVVCLVVAIMRQHEINKKIEHLDDEIGAAVDSTRHDHQLILQGLDRIERRQEMCDGPRGR